MDKRDRKELYPHLKKECLTCSNVNVKIVIDSKVFRKTEKGYEECNFDEQKKYHNVINNFNENKFEITFFGWPLDDIDYEKLDYWAQDDYVSDIIHLSLNVPIVLYSGKGLKLEKF
jgi:hypothetical protein